MARRPLFWLALTVVAAGGLALRLPQLDLRPMHTDEAVHTVKFDELWHTGVYQYDPQDYHGPTLYYLTLPVVWLSGARDFAATEAWMYRLVPVACGFIALLLVGLLADGLGRWAALVSATLAAVSPATVFYSRYYIQETLLVCFTLLLLGAGWRYLQTRRIRWAVLTGLGVGLMHATKETCVITWGTLALSIAIVWWTTRCAGPSSSASVQTASTPRALRSLRLGLLVGFATATVVSTALFSVFFTLPRGIFDSLATFASYLHRAGSGIHDHPWDYYLRLLVYWRDGAGPVWTEALIVALAVLGGVAAWLRPPQTTNAAGRAPGDSFSRWVTFDVRLARSLALFAVLLVVVYSAIPYKTPWCVLTMLQALILLAGLGAVELVRLARRTPARIVIIAVLALGAVHLARQAAVANFRYYASARNPYVYAQTVPDVELLAAELEHVAAAAPAHHHLLIYVIADNPWPLPWYLRRFPRVGYWPAVPAQPDADVVLASHTLESDLVPRLHGAYNTEYFGLRRDEVLLRCIRSELWQACLAQFAPPASPPAPPVPVVEPTP
jgi:uncharacterized protein (TIGR03663 family)